jgi:hypothetical protein
MCNWIEDLTDPVIVQEVQLFQDKIILQYNNDTKKPGSVFLPAGS